MKVLRIILLAIILSISTLSCSGSKEKSDINSSDKQDTDSIPVNVEDEIPLGVKALMDSYPDFVVGIESNHVIMRNSSKILYDDGREKTFQQWLDESDIEDMFKLPYTTENSEPSFQYDSGRSRCDSLFMMMYGSTPAKVEKQLVSVDWFGKKVKFSSTNGAAKQLMKVKEELAKMPQFAKYYETAGTYYWRKVRGANRMSAHSYGIAIDIGVKYSSYWLWSAGTNNENVKVKYSNKIPVEIVNVFERHGFIWGGRWYHFDTMHFEYRPELLKYQSLKNK